MAFHIDTYNIPPLRNYGDALHYWDRIKPWRGDSDTNSRPLAGRNKRHMTIRKLNDDSIAMRLHHTDVVVYHPDGDITLESYPSVSTDMFASTLTPWGVGTSFNSQGGSLVHLEQNNVTMTYKMAMRSVRLRKGADGWHAVLPNEFAPFNKYSVNMKKAREVLKELRFADFVAWYKAANALSAPVARTMAYMNHAETVRHLKEAGDCWEVLRSMMQPDDVREAVYGVYGCIVTTEVPAIAGHDVSAVIASRRRWAHLVTDRY